ncbi:hypothetical protein B6I21_07470 [candidate division KSB1 bacterium 4572_119]|nr:MAG: hypothetical protein B6I21_07470 [candidate division KSB1 bacterium 4572_119]
MEKIGYALLGIVAVIYVIGLFVGMIVALPWGIIGLIAILGIGTLFIKVLSDRIGSKEDDYYEKNVEK